MVNSGKSETKFYILENNASHTTDTSIMTPLSERLKPFTSAQRDIWSVSYRSDKKPHELHPVALMLMNLEGKAKKLDAKFTQRIASLKAELGNENNGTPKRNAFLKQSLEHFEDLRCLNAQDVLDNGPLWQQLSSKFHWSNSLTHLILRTGLMCLAKLKGEKAIKQLGLTSAMSIISQERGYKEFMETVCPGKASEFAHAFQRCFMLFKAGLLFDHGAALRHLDGLMLSVVLEVKDYPKGIRGSSFMKTFLPTEITEAFACGANSGEEELEMPSENREEAAERLVIGFEDLRSIGPATP
jgi:hypothetical protein